MARQKKPKSWWDIQVLIYMVKKRLYPETKVPVSVAMYYFEREALK